MTTLKNIRIDQSLRIFYAIFIICAFGFAAAHSHGDDYEQLGAPHDCVVCAASTDMDEGYIPAQIIIRIFNGSSIIEPVFSGREFRAILVAVQARAPPVLV